MAWITTNSTLQDPDLVLSGPSNSTSFRFLQDAGVPSSSYSVNLLWVLVNYWNLYRIAERHNSSTKPTPSVGIFL